MTRGPARGGSRSGRSGTIHPRMGPQPDVLVLDDFLVYKDKQPKWEETSNWREEFGLD